MSDDTSDDLTSNLDLAAYLVAHGRQPGAYLERGQQLVTFFFRRDDSLLALIEEYSTGAAIVSARTILYCRRRLYRAIRLLKEGSHAT